MLLGEEIGAVTLIFAVCVVAAVFDAVDRGYDVVLVKDAVCSSADETHDALITVYASRLSQQVTLVTSRDVIAAWQRSVLRK